MYEGSSQGIESSRQIGGSNSGDRTGTGVGRALTGGRRGGVGAGFEGGVVEGTIRNARWFQITMRNGGEFRFDRVETREAGEIEAKLGENDYGQLERRGVGDDDRCGFDAVAFEQTFSGADEVAGSCDGFG